jgi:hypothetical protein
MEKNTLRQLTIVALGFVMCVALHAQVFEKSEKEKGRPANSYPIHGSDLLWKQELEVRKFITQHPEAIVSHALHKTAWTFTVGSTKSWYADNLTDYSRYLVSSTCRAVGTNCYIFVEDSSWNKDLVTQGAVDSVRMYFDSKTPADPSKGIFATDTSTFGNPPNVDGDQKIIILLLDIIDGYTGSGGFVGGYFYSFNEVNPSTPGYSTSNFAEIFFIDTDPLDLTTTWGLNDVISTLAHEFQHMIHFNYDPNEISFIDEGCATLAEVACGFPIYNPTLYANEPNHYLFDWRSDLSTVLSDYSRAARFMVYIHDQAGIGVFKNIVASVLHGTDGIDAGLQASESILRFNDILRNWFIANILDDRSIDPLYGYIYPNLPKSVGHTFFDPNVSLTTDTVQKYAVQYLSFKSGSQLKATITCSDPALIVKVVEIGPSTKRILDVTSGVEFSEPGFDTTYNEVHFVIMNPSPNTAYTYTYQASGKDTSLELKYDFGEPPGYYTLSTNDTICVWFNAVAGGRLDSIRVAIRQAGTMNGGIWIFTGAIGSTPLGTKLASISATVTATPNYPYPVPWNNWGTADVHALDIRTDFPFAVAFINPGSSTSLPHIMHTVLPLPSTFTSLVYLHAPSSGIPGWYYIVTNNAGDSVANWMIRAYVSFSPKDTSQHIVLTPANIVLEQNFPNPFNPATTIRYKIPFDGYVTLKVYDIMGREIATLVDGERNAGILHRIQFDASYLSSGVYFYRIIVGTFSETKKLILIK